MGLIKAFTSSLSSELADQYLEYFYCDSLSNDILATKGKKKNTKKSANHGSADVITDGSGIVVNDGQCALIVSQGSIVEVCGEAGVYTYHSASEPSIFTGDLAEGIVESFHQLTRRFAHGGEIPVDQRVYYINTKEILNNKFGTSNPLPFRIVDARTGIDFDLSIRCFGSYSFQIKNPILFYKNVCGNITSDFRFAQLSGQLKEELLNSMIPAFHAIAQKGVRYSEIGLHSEEIRSQVAEALDAGWANTRGLNLVSLNFGSIDIPPEDLDRIKDIQQTAVYTNASMLGAKLGLAQADAMKSAAANSSAGPMMAFAGMNMAANAGTGTGFQSMLANGQGIAPVNNSNTTAPSASVWKCSCGTDNSGKFCTECGSKKPGGAIVYQCDKCGWKPADPTNPPRFCPECGDPFDANDIKI